MLITSIICNEELAARLKNFKYAFQNQWNHDLEQTLKLEKLNLILVLEKNLPWKLKKNL